MSYNYSGAYASTIVIIEFQFVKFYQVFIIIWSIGSCWDMDFKTISAPQKWAIFSWKCQPGWEGKLSLCNQKIFSALWWMLLTSLNTALPSPCSLRLLLPLMLATTVRTVCVSAQSWLSSPCCCRKNVRPPMAAISPRRRRGSTLYSQHSTSPPPYPPPSSAPETVTTLTTGESGRGMWCVYPQLRCIVDSSPWLGLNWRENILSCHPRNHSRRDRRHAGALSSALIKRTTFIKTLHYMLQSKIQRGRHNFHHYVNISTNLYWNGKGFACLVKIFVYVL